MSNATSDQTASSGATLRDGIGVVVRALLVFGGVAPFVPASMEGTPGLDAVGRALDAWFSFQCHREVERGFTAIAVCARCLGIYVGLALGALVVRPRLASKYHAVWMLGAAAVLVADVLSEAVGLRPPNAALRFVTGFALAYPAGIAIVRAFARRPDAGGGLVNQS